MIYIGMDVHKKNLSVCVLDESGAALERCKVKNLRDSVINYMSKWSQPAKVALEPTHNWGMLYDLLEGLDFDVRIANPREVKLIARSRVKTDKYDAYCLAALLRADFLPEAYVPDSDGRELRRLLRTRSSLKGVGTQLKNQIHATLREKWIDFDYSDLFGKAGRKFLADLDVESGYKVSILTRLDTLAETEKQIALIDVEIAKLAQMDKRAMLLTTIKGIGPYSALLILAEIGTIARFSRAESLVRYSGLNPSESSSGATVRRGRIEKAGSRWLRWILVEAVQHTIKEEGKIRDLYLRVFEKKGRKWAIVAAARELLVSIYWMLKRMEPFRPSGKRDDLLIASQSR